MAEIKISKKIYSGQDLKDIQQPLDYKKTGRVNKEFDKLYGQKSMNPYWGTERDTSKERVEYFKRKDEFLRYQGQMTGKEKESYQKKLQEQKERSVRGR